MGVKTTLAELYPTKAEQIERNKPKNNGGVLGGVGYTLEKLGLSALQGFEGLSDFTVGGISKLLGFDEFAESLFDNDVVNYQHADEWYNPSKGWQVAGDVTGGVGSSVPTFAAAVLAAAAVGGSGGAAAPAVVPMFAKAFPLTVAFGSAAGTSTKEAYRQTGNLGAKEFGYGALSGMAEAGMELVTQGIGTGSGRITKAILNKASGDTAKTLGRIGGKSVLKSIVGDFASEAFEEGTQEMLDGQFKRWTIDPMAENATPEEIAYAAIIGGLSGALMGGGYQAVNTTSTLISGNKAVKTGTAEWYMDAAKKITETESANETGFEPFKATKDAYNSLVKSLEKTGGTITTAKQKMLLGEIKSGVTASVFMPYVEKSAMETLANADVVAERLAKYKMTDANGKVINFSAEELTKGIDMSLANSTNAKDRQLFLKQVRQALSSNSALATVAIMDTTGNLMLDTQAFAEATIKGQNLASKVDLNKFVETASPEEISAVEQALGIDDISNVDINEFRQRVADYTTTADMQENVAQFKRMKDAKSIDPDKALPFPARFTAETQDGTYKQDDIVVFKDGDRYHIYDYNADKITRSLTEAEVNDTVDKLSEQTTEQTERRSLPEEAKELDEYARANIKDYAKLNANNQAMIRKVLRNARRNGISESEALSYARISAHSGLDIVFDKKACERGLNKNGEMMYADGFYSPTQNKIIVNPDSSRSLEKTIIHELDHSIRMYYKEDGKIHSKAYKVAIESVSEEDTQRIAEAYSKVNRNVPMLELLLDETNAFAAEQLLSNRNTLDRLVAEEPSIKDRILNFFKGASKDYSGDKNLEKASREYYKTYKKLFDEFSARNQQSNSIEAPAEIVEEKSKRYAFAGVNAKEADKTALDKAIAMDNEGKDSETIRQETGWFKGYDGKWRFEIDDSKMKFHPAMILTKAGDSISHTTLFKHYPTLKDLPIVLANGTLVELDEVTNGGYSNSDNFITIKQGLSEAQKTKTIIHELQHAIQRIEGFTSGASISQYINSDKILRDVKTKNEMNSLWEKTVKSEEIIDEKGLSNLYSDYLFIPNENLSEVELAQKENIESKFKEAGILNELKTAKTSFDAYEELMDKRLDPLTAYQQTAGEIEARNTSARLYLDKEGRKATRPDIDQEDYVFAEDYRYALPIDQEYKSALESGDMEKADKLVRKAAKEAGYDIKAYHGTQADFTKFSKAKQGSNYGDWSEYGKGFYFTPNKKEAEMWSKKGIVVSAFLKSNKMLDVKEKTPNTLMTFLPERAADGDISTAKKSVSDWMIISRMYKIDTSKVLKEIGYDGIKDINVSNYGIMGQFVVFEPNQIKSADTITYDNNGKVIPLSERFNEGKDDIRYALPIDQKYMQAIETNDMEKANKLVKKAALEWGAYAENGNPVELYHGTPYYKDINVFKKGKSGWLGGGIYLTSEKSIADRYAKSMGNGKTYSLYANVMKPLIVTSENPALEIIKAIYGRETVYKNRVAKQTNNTQLITSKDISKLQELGYDGILWDYANTKEFSVFNPNQIKSADTITYDDNGKVIPLSERFNEKNGDIRYALPLTDAVSNYKNAQFKIIQETNPMWDDFHTGIRSPKDILTFEEAIQDDESFTWGDFSKADAEEALEKGTVTVYSSYPIKNGTFVSTSYQQALEYAGRNRNGVHQRKVALDSVAWINGDEGQYAKVYALPLDQEYMEAVNSNDTAKADELVQKAAKEAGYDSPKLYHGTSKFGYTYFNTPYIFATDDESTARGYGKTDYANKRSISTKYVQDDGTDNTLVKNARNLLKQNIRRVNDEDISSIATELSETAQEIASEIEKADTNEARAELEKIGEIDADAFANVAWFADSVRAYLTEYDKIPQNEIKGLVNSFNKSIETIKQFYRDHYNEFKQNKNALKFVKPFVGYDTSDLAIDVEYKLLSAMKDDMFINEYGNISSADTLRENIERIKSIGSYQLYADFGNKPLVIDANNAFWTNIKVDQWEEVMGTDAIARRAKKEGFTSVTINNVYDMAMNNYSTNAKTNVYVLFNPNQVKSADTITYDDNGNIIPLSQRFNQNDSDIRYAIPLDDTDPFFDDTEEEMPLSKVQEIKMKNTLAKGSPRQESTADKPLGQIKKIVANSTHNKVYSKSEAMGVIDALTGTQLSVTEKNKLGDALWQGLNDSTTQEKREAFAKDMAEYITAKLVTEATVDNPDIADATERISYIKTGVAKLTFSDTDKAEIKHMADVDGYRQILGRWGNKQKNGRAYPMATFVNDIATEMPGMSYLSEMHPADAFMEINKIYGELLDTLHNKKINAYDEVPAIEIESMQNEIENAILQAFDTEGTKSKFKVLIDGRMEEWIQRAENYKTDIGKITARNKIIGQLVNDAYKMRDLKIGTFKNATQADTDIFKNSIEQLARIQFRGNINVTGIRKIFTELMKWYRKDNPVLNYESETSPGLYAQSVADMLETIATGEKALSNEELYVIHNTMAYFTKFVENYGKVYRQGKYVDAAPVAEKYVSKIQNIAQHEENTPAIVKLLGNNAYFKGYSDPMAIARMADRYDPEGFFTETMYELRDAAVKADMAELKVKEDYNNFIFGTTTEKDGKKVKVKGHPKYIAESRKEDIDFKGNKISKLQLIGLYMTLKRKHAQAGYIFNGFKYKNSKGDEISVPGITDYRNAQTMTEEQLAKMVESELSAIATHFNATDLEYIRILEKAYNTDTKRLKAERDMARLGFTNASEAYYYPIRRADTKVSVDNPMQDEINRVTNSSFNKDTIKGAKQKLMIEDADSLFNRHVHAVCQYAMLVPAVETFDILYNMDVSGNRNAPVSVRTTSANIFKNSAGYFKELVKDIQGIKDFSSFGMKVLSFLRSGYAKYQLGANPKTWLTQLSSLFASTHVLDADSVIKGFHLSAKDVYDYSDVARLRSEDNQAIKADALIDKLGRVSDVLMMPIQKTDDLVIRRLYGACQVQVQKDQGLKIGTTENKKAAAKLLDKVIFETQQNSLATEKSAAMRTSNELLRSMTMFTSDMMKATGRVIDAVGRYFTLKKLSEKSASIEADSKKINTFKDAQGNQYTIGDKVELGDDFTEDFAKAISEAKDGEVFSYGNDNYIMQFGELHHAQRYFAPRTATKAEVKTAAKSLRKSLSALVSVALFTAALSQLWRAFLKRDDDDEDKAKVMLLDSVGNLFAGMPVIKDIYAFMVDGYELENYTYSTINDVLSSTKALADSIGKLNSPDASRQDMNRAIRNMAYSVGQVFGLPFRNAYNLFFGLTKRFSPKTAYKIENGLYKKNFESDLYDAIDKGDDKKINFIMGMLLEEQGISNMDRTVFDEVVRLSGEGEKVLPKTVPTTITVGGERIALAQEEQDEISQYYSQAEKSLVRLIKSQGYRQLTDTQKADAIKLIYNVEYNNAVNGVFGIEKADKQRIMGEIVGNDVMAVFKVGTQDLTNDVDRRGDVVKDSKRRKVVNYINSMPISREEKLLLIATKGYTVRDGDLRGLRKEQAMKILLNFIVRSNLSKSDKEYIAKMCGFTVKNGRIMNPFGRKY